MKRRFLSMLLCLSLVASLFAMAGGAAYADDTQTYTVQLGDTLISICKACGVDYSKNVAWILKKNELKSADALPLGKTLTLPAAGKVYTTDGGTGSTASASSGYSVPVQYHTLQNGEIVIKVCEQLKVDFYKNEAWIKAANNITSWNNLAVGRTIVLPAANTVPALSTATKSSTATTASTTTATSTAAATTAATTTATATGTSLNLASGDTVRYYLVSYSVKSGDTLGNICSAYGTNIATVQQLNNISNAAKIYVGQTLSIPSTTKPTSGSFTAIVAHRVTSGETVQAICSKYGMALDANLTNQIKALNNKSNINKIQVGEQLLLPVKGTITAASTTATTGTTGTTASTGSTTSSSQASLTYYTLNKSATAHGNYSLTVNGVAVNGAAPNQTVHVVATYDHGYKLGGISVTKIYNGAAVTVDENYDFVMPACDVSIVVSFVEDPNAVAHKINTSINSAPEAKLTYVVNGYSNTTAEPGQTVRVIISKLADGYFVDGVSVTAKDGSSVTVNSDLTFTMPASEVNVTVSVKAS